MKICPLVTQVAILDDKDLLIRELDDVEPAADHPAESGEGDSLFINPEASPGADAPALDEIAPNVPVRFIGKSYRGRIECLGDVCRFYDNDSNACRLERALQTGGATDALAEFRDAVEQSLAPRDEGMKAIRSLLEDFGGQHRTSIEEQRNALEGKIDELRELIRTTAKERDTSLEAFSLTLDARSEEIERKIEANTEGFASLRGDISTWKDVLDSRLEESRRLVNDLSQNHAGIMQVVESQRRSLAEEERKRIIAEARRHNNGGVMAYHNGQYEKARELFKKAIDLDPSMTEAYNNLGLVFTEMNEEKQATEAFRKAIELAPELAAAYNNLGYVFYRLGSYQEAIEMYNEAIGRSKDNASAYTNLGNAFYKLKRIDEAIDAWKKALTIDPANEKAKRNLKRFHAEVN
jgi:tetratricopeptide (TPR) repeat protein